MRRISFATFLIGMSVANHCAAGDLTPDALLNELTIAKPRLEDFYMRGVTIVTRVQTHDDQSRVMTESDFRYIASSDRFMLRATESRKLSGPAPVPTWDVIVGTPEGIFRIAKHEGNSYFIRGALPWDDMTFYSYCSGDLGVALPIADLELPLVNFLKFPDMHIRSCTDAEWFGARLKKVSAFRDFKGGTEYEFFFDATRGWLYQGKEQRNIQNKARAMARVSYQDDCVTPKRWELRLIPANGQEYMRYSADVIEFRKEQHSKNEFALAQFDLPEPVGDSTQSRQLPVYLWLVVAAALCAVLSIVFRSAARRFISRQVRSAP